MPTDRPKMTKAIIRAREAVHLAREVMDPTHPQARLEVQFRRMAEAMAAMLDAMEAMNGDP